MKDFLSSSDSDEVEIMMSRNCREVEDESIGDAIGVQQCDMNVLHVPNVGDEVNVEEGVDIGDGVNVEDRVNVEETAVEDRVNVEDGDNVGDKDSANMISSLSSDIFEPFVGKEFDEVEDAQAFSKAYARRKGVNHHHQTIMFGCALLVNETAESYVWLLRTWQEAMLGRPPLTIITDDDKAMAKAIGETITTDEFEHEWSAIVAKYGLIDNYWLQNLYNRREKWVPAYLRTTFCASMSTTQRSESMNNFFKNYARSSTMVSDFVHQYEKALDARYFKEKEKDVRTKSTRAIMKTLWKIEEDAASVYTRKSFMIFQDELFNSQWYKSTKVDKEGENIFCVLERKSKLDMLPHHYILERWCINAKSRAIIDIPNSDGIVMTKDDPTMRKNKLMMQFYDIAELGSQSIHKCNHLSLALDKEHKELLLMEEIEGKEKAEGGNMSLTDSQMLRSQVVSNFTQILLDPPRVPTKGRPKSLRAKNPKETQIMKKRRCSICKTESHAKNNCPSVRGLGNTTGNKTSSLDPSLQTTGGHAKNNCPSVRDLGNTTGNIS
ncbi:protein FAR1-RELATED SEQUENCE 5-like [Juglans microcarpa x Juglans regia]|uniref:protein FAR1-RELATED SEQUENCE 5-like n=1 Tax=Juglans microcarpa x Juglans regia TaxID=2249226 RepID=UPI001B7E87F4|nr:protein FAR1-RELATED SEQUENCE 5-like [Juglans microcarpa x Juglans regia]